MRPAENIKRLIENAKVKIDPDVKEAALGELVNELGKTKIVNLEEAAPNIWVKAARSRIAQVAAVLIVLSAICLLTLSDKGEPEQYETAGTEVAVTSETPAELVSAISLSMAFRDGDLKAVERQFDKAEKKVKPGLTEQITIDQLICELEGC